MSFLGRSPFSGKSNMLFLLYFSVVCILFNTFRRWVVIFSLFQKRKRFFAITLPPTQDSKIALLFTNILTSDSPNFELLAKQITSLLHLSQISRFYVWAYNFRDVEFAIIYFKGWNCTFFEREFSHSTFSERDYKTAESDIWAQSFLFFSIENHLLFPNHYLKSQF